MTRPAHASLEAAVADAREVLARPPAERWRRQARYAAYASRLVVAEYPEHAGTDLAAEGLALRERLRKAFEEACAEERAESKAAIAAARRPPRS
ncbi:hypothetical protein SAMN02799631_03187 [Methylobacterium sp. 174MFSha1.1]|uniref:hypothetical protein n=1 Tax=Methylobacterium sp. 174MFSha1.1 TaxID=1502749 RepID=UPI0008F37047|nr:hypothetical protein [Methylobacterium sp. 174MFSha1.1]SFU92782.1 hypothetical protein SAMN02799631_03187 [Methylobacterium sp. 174MFSha1.1]